MKKFLAVTAAVAALAFAVPAANSQTPAQMYIVQDASGNRMVMGGDSAEGMALLKATGDAAPGDCPEGGYWEDSKQLIHPCTGEGAFMLKAPEAGTMMPSGQPYPENAMMMVEEGTADAGGTGAPSGQN